MKRDFSLLNKRTFDLLVCGGGIYGAWTAYDAALRGLQVALVDQGDWAGATSACSSKLIHGGLRYLETYDFSLVKKALRERQMLLDVAPHRVWPLRFGVPVYAGSRIRPWQLKTGLTLYDFMSADLLTPKKHLHFEAYQFAEHFPLLKSDQLQCGFTYADAQTDDARLVLELIDGAMRAGAVCVNYCTMTGFIEQEGQAVGAFVKNQIDNESTNISAKAIVNSTGRWITQTAEGNSWCRLSKGIHLVLPATLGEEALLLTAQSDGRVFFMIPWYGLTLVGTTDSNYQGDITQLHVEPAEIAYLLAESNRYLKTPWNAKDIIGSYAGLRVIRQGDNSSVTNTSRDWELKTATNGVHYSVGGKITSARKDAASIVNRVCNQIGSGAPCMTQGKNFPWSPEGNYLSWLAEVNFQARKLGIDEESAKWLFRRYGKHVVELFHIIMDDSRMADRIVAALPFIYADLLWSAENEMVVHLDDLLRRRMPLLILAKLADSELRRIAEYVASIMKWDEMATNNEIERCKNTQYKNLGEDGEQQN